MNATIALLIAVCLIQLVMVGFIVLISQQLAMVNYKMNMLGSEADKKKRTPKPKPVGFKIAKPKVK